MITGAPGMALQTRRLTVRFTAGHRSLTAVDQVDIELPAGQVLGLVGESGSGKSTLARAIVGLVRATEGQVLLHGQDLRALPAAKARAMRRRVQLVFQDPYASLNPRMTVGDTLAEALSTRGIGGQERGRDIGRLLNLVALDRRHADLLPRELSGGQRQRVAIARALAVQPEVLIADEITSALDVSVQGAILNLIRDIQAHLGLSMLFISHNLALVRYLSDVVAVMYLGRIVEAASTEELTSRPRHPYTRALLDAVPTFGAARAEESSTLDADPADPHVPPAGCHFHPRCPIGPLVLPERSLCASEDPRTRAEGDPHRTACHFPS